MKIQHYVSSVLAKELQNIGFSVDSNLYTLGLLIRKYPGIRLDTTKDYYIAQDSKGITTAKTPEDAVAKLILRKYEVETDIKSHN